MILTYIIDIDETLKLTQGQGHKVKGQGHIGIYVKKQFGLQLMNVLMDFYEISCDGQSCLGSKCFTRFIAFKIKHTICDKLGCDLYLRGVNVLVKLINAYHAEMNGKTFDS